MIDILEFRECLDGSNILWDSVNAESIGEFTSIWGLIELLRGVGESLDYFTEEELYPIESFDEEDMKVIKILKNLKNTSTQNKLWLCNLSKRNIGEYIIDPKLVSIEKVDVVSSRKTEDSYISRNGYSQTKQEWKGELKASTNLGEFILDFKWGIESWSDNGGWGGEITGFSKDNPTTYPEDFMVKLKEELNEQISSEFSERSFKDVLSDSYD